MAKADEALQALHGAQEAVRRRGVEVNEPVQPEAVIDRQQVRRPASMLTAITDAE